MADGTAGREAWRATGIETGNVAAGDVCYRDHLRSAGNFPARIVQLGSGLESLRGRLNAAFDNLPSIPPAARWAPWLGAGLLVALHYHFYHRVEWGWALWWGVKDGLLWGAVTALLWGAIARLRALRSRLRLAIVLAALPALGAVMHSVAAVSLSYLVEGYSMDQPFADAVNLQLVKKAPLNFSIFLGVTVILLVFKAQRAGRQQPVANRLVIPTPRGEAYVRLDEVDRIEAEGNYLAIHAGERRYLERRTMRDAERSLTEAGFARIHRSHLINLERLERVERTAAGSYRAVLADGTRLPMSRACRKRLKEDLA